LTVITGRVAYFFIIKSLEEVLMAYSKEIDRKWQKRWEEAKLYKFDRNKLDKKLYCLEMFSYPSGANLHVGHWYNYGLSDSWARMKRMQGYNVFHPMGFDAFGLPAENYAIKTGIHPQDSTMKNISTMKQQLKEMGATFDWDYEVITCEPEYYKWTQWLFLQFYKRGLAYRKEAPVNWCPKCKTVLANEQVKDGLCERCDSEVLRRNLTQWFLKITEYAEELLEKINDLDWPEKTKKIQTNWIGKSEGAEIEFKIADTDLSFKVFTTRADTLFGVTYVVLAPEHELVDKITTPEYRQQVEEYKLFAQKQSEIERMSTVKEKTGVPTGAYAIHPLTGKKVPIWIADYVLSTYGTGCVMAVPAHDERDYEFAAKFGLDIVRVIVAKDGKETELPFVEDGKMINSGPFNGLSSEEARKEIVKKLEEQGMGRPKVNYRLRDWLVSRQRYWGAPIPMIHCEKCGIVPVPEEDLPVLLPYNVEFTPDGDSPLKKCKEFMNVKCPQCSGPAQRDPDTLDTFVDSSWYFLRYPDNKNTEKPFDSEWINKILPVDKYIGGAEHATMHLLYARFFTKALRDMGYLNFDEPFLSLVHQGTILGDDGNKMSKSLGNTVSPDEYIDQYGSDVFRMYLGFGFSYVDGGPWSEDGIKAIAKFISRVERLIDIAAEIKKVPTGEDKYEKEEKELNYVRNYAIKAVTHDADRFQFNTSISRMMELVNALYKYESEVSQKNTRLFTDTVLDLLKLMAPFAPHFAEEMWEKMGMSFSIFNESWPLWDEKALAREEIEIAVQINGAVKHRLNVPASADNEEIERIVFADAKVNALLAGKAPKKVIIVKNRLVNIVV